MNSINYDHVKNLVWENQKSAIFAIIILYDTTFWREKILAKQFTPKLADNILGNQNCLIA